jgi:hypothetical protein
MNLNDNLRASKREYEDMKLCYNLLSRYAEKTAYSPHLRETLEELLIYAGMLRTDTLKMAHEIRKQRHATSQRRVAISDTECDQIPPEK